MTKPVLRSVVTGTAVGIVAYFILSRARLFLSAAAGAAMGLAGTILRLDPVRQYTAEPTTEPTTIRIYPGKNGEFRLYGDDGASLDYAKGSSIGRN
jgi:Domain of unknown function (DUF5110)